MRLLFVSRSTPFHRLGGMELVAWNLACALEQRGHSIEFLTTPAPGLSETNVIDNVKIRTLQVCSGRYSAAWWRKSAACFRSDYAQRTDLVLGIGGGAHAILDMARAMCSKIPVVIQSHGTPWGEIISKLAVRTPKSWAGAIRNVPFLLRDWRLGHYSAILSIGPAVTTALQEPPMCWLARKAPIFTIENGVNENLFLFDHEARRKLRDHLGISQSTKVVVSVSRVTLQKGLRESLIGFMEASRDRFDTAYLIAGEGDAEPTLRNLVSERGFESRVFFLGRVERSDLPAVLSAADQFLFTSLRQEGLAIAPLEAAASGLPSILSQHIIPSGLVATPVNPFDDQQVASAIRLGFERSTSRESLLPVRYSLHGVTDRYEELFHQLTDRSIAEN